MATAIATEDLQCVCVMDGRVNYDQQSTHEFNYLTMHKRTLILLCNSSCSLIP